MKSITARIHFPSDLKAPDAVAEQIAQIIADAIVRGNVRDNTQPTSATKVEAWPTRED